MKLSSIAYYRSPIGLLEVSGIDDGITAVSFVDQARHAEARCYSSIEDCVNQLDEYFHHSRQVFSIRVLLQGTAFQKQVWQQLLTIPFGHTVSYLDIAAAIGSPAASQAVGNANGKNPAAIIVPCHRVLGNNGKLVGYAGGVRRKEWLLRHEGAWLV